MGRNRQHHPHRQVVAVARYKNTARHRQPRENRLRIRHLRMGNHNHRQIGQRHRDLGLILPLDNELLQFYPQVRGRLRKIQNSIQHGGTL